MYTRWEQACKSSRHHTSKAHPSCSHTTIKAQAYQGLCSSNHRRVRFNTHINMASLCPLLLTLRPAHCLLRTACPPQAPAAVPSLNPSSCLCCPLPCVLLWPLTLPKAPWPTTFRISKS